MLEELLGVLRRAGWGTVARLARAVFYPQNAVERALLLTDQNRFGLAITNHAGRTVSQGGDHPLLATTFRSERSEEKRHLHASTARNVPNRLR